MPLIIHIMTSGARHLFVAMAIVAMVMSSVGFHVHKELAVNVPGNAHSSHRCNHAATNHAVAVLSDAAIDNAVVDNTTTPLTPLDPDGCGHCHCQVPTTDLPVIAGLLINSALQGVLLMPSEPLALDGICLQPEPPPIRS